MSRRFPTLNELRAMLHGAAIGARLALGPTRWCELQPTLEIAGWVAAAIVNLAALYLSLPLWQRAMTLIMGATG